MDHIQNDTSMSIENRRKLGQFLKDRRVSLGLTAKQVAQGASITTAYLFVLEKTTFEPTKKNPKPSLRVLFDLAQTLRFSQFQIRQVLTLVGYDNQLTQFDESRDISADSENFVDTFHHNSTLHSPLLPFQLRDAQNFFPRTDLQAALKERIIEMTVQLADTGKKQAELLLNDLYVPPIAIYGMGGIGKSTLLFKAISELHVREPNCKICYVDCENHSDSEMELLQHILKTMTKDLAILESIISRQYFTKRINSLNLQLDMYQYLVLLDGCANRDFLPFCVNSLCSAGIGVIVTMRGNPQSYVFPTANQIQVLPFDEDDAITYFQKLTIESCQITDTGQISKLVGMVNRNPLAIRLLAMMAADSLQPFDEFVDEIDRVLQVSKVYLDQTAISKNIKIDEIVSRIVSINDAASIKLFSYLGVFHKRLFLYDAAVAIARAFDYSATDIETLIHRGLITFHGRRELAAHDELHTDDERIGNEKTLAMHTLVHFAARRSYGQLEEEEEDKFRIDKALFEYYSHFIEHLKQKELDLDRILAFHKEEPHIYALFQRNPSEKKLSLEKIKLAFALLPFWQKYWNIHDSYEIVVTAAKSVDNIEVTAPEHTGYQKEIWKNEFAIFLANVFRRIGLFKLASNIFDNVADTRKDLSSENGVTEFHLLFAHAQLLRTIGQTNDSSDIFQEIIEKASRQCMLMTNHPDLFPHKEGDLLTDQRRMERFHADALYYLAWIEMEKGNFISSLLKIRESLKIIILEKDYHLKDDIHQVIEQLEYVISNKKYSDARTLGRCLHRLGMLHLLQAEQLPYAIGELARKKNQNELFDIAQKFFQLCDTLNNATQDEQGKLAIMLANARLNSAQGNFQSAKRYLAMSEEKSDDVLDHFALVYTKLLKARVLLEEAIPSNLLQLTHTHTHLPAANASITASLDTVFTHNAEIQQTIHSAESILKDAHRYNTYETWVQSIPINIASYTLIPQKLTGSIWYRMEAIEHEICGLIAFLQQNTEKAQREFEEFARISHEIRYVLDEQKAQRYLLLVEREKDYLQQNAVIFTYKATDDPHSYVPISKKKQA